ncbi:hypothetical protein A2U01_0069977, partial [Trifolium medium]|nr:hypothetical protein [Trifolium medium]
SDSQREDDDYTSDVDSAAYSDSAIDEDEDLSHDEYMEVMTVNYMIFLVLV